MLVTLLPAVLHQVFNFKLSVAYLKYFSSQNATSAVFERLSVVLHPSVQTEWARGERQELALNSGGGAQPGARGRLKRLK